MNMASTMLSFLLTALVAINLPASISASTIPPTNYTYSTTPALRILPLGNSITYGYLSTSGNGYRLPLLNLLTPTFQSVTYIGSVHSGNMTNNANEGHPGAIISEIQTYAQNPSALNARPNIILLMAGTNDMNNPTLPETAPTRLGSLIDLCIQVCPDAAVLVAQLTPASDAAVEERIRTFNRAVPGVVEQRRREGKKVLVVDMSVLSTADLNDGLHPTDGGYEKMAKVWFGGVKDVVARGWVAAPVVV